MIGTGAEMHSKTYSQTDPKWGNSIMVKKVDDKITSELQRK